MNSSHPFAHASSGFDGTSGRIIAIGASAGGLDACRILLEAMPSGGGNTFILVQHLDPVHESLLAELLSRHTPMTVIQARDGQKLEPDHLFIIPPGRYMGVQADTIRLTTPPDRRGTRMPFDFLLQALAAEYGARATAVVLSGTGTDGSIGIGLIRAAGGRVYVQDPDEADYDGMPKSAIASGMAEHVMPLAAIAGALHRPPPARDDARPPSKEATVDRILTMLRETAGKDFALYKQGTLLRRMERRMAMAGIASSDTARYLDVLKQNPLELSQLATDILINVTNFFRDPEVFERLRATIVPELVKNHPPGRTLRLWVAGCSTGEEAYSLGMIVQECISQARRDIQMQIFASDADEAAVAFARDGFYPLAINADVSPERLQRFFTQEEHGYRIASELRSSVIFAVQNVLSDPPFSNVDFISCRNLLIYLGPEAQAKVIALCHFALNENGILLLGNTETVGTATNRFDVLDKSARIFRRKGQRGRYGFAINATDNVRVPAQQGQAPSRQAALADLCRRMVLDTYAPATVLINRKHEYLYSLGPVQRYLRIAHGYPSQDLFTMTPRSVHTKLRSALHRARQEHARIVATGLYHDADDTLSRYEIAVQPVVSDGEDLFLVSFLDTAQPPEAGERPEDATPDDRSGALERELATTRTELQAAIRDLENAAEEQKAINAETLSLNEEYQSANEELLTSKEELQSLNEELTALNAQLHEALERQRATANDLENVLYSTDVATIFLDPGLNIRYFTPATRSIFNVIMGDIGRPLVDLNARVPDATLLGDASAILNGSATREREVRTGNGTWYMRRVMPYRTQEEGMEGVVITFADVTSQHRAHEALDRAKQAAERANAAKSRFLAAASHDLRQPLQSLVLLQGLLEQSVEGEQARKLVRSFGDTLGSMSGMLNALLDINQIEAGTVQPRIITCPVNDVLQRLADEFGYSAAEKGLRLRFVPSSLLVRTDPRLLEQIVRNLLANALKYTRQGKILLGCRRHKDALAIEVWDSGVGIPSQELQAIFDEYHQAAGEEADLGLGLGLSIVKRLNMLLGHEIEVRSVPGKGSVFLLRVALGRQERQEDRPPIEQNTQAPPLRGTVLLIEDDQKVRSLIEIALRDEHHLVYAADSSAAAIELVSSGMVVPALILADYNLPNELNGLDVTKNLRALLGRSIPAIVLTGDIRAETLRILSAENCLHMPKPVSLGELLKAIQLLLRTGRIEPHGERQGEPQAPPPGAPAIYVIDDDDTTREALRESLEADGRRVLAFSDGETFLAAFNDALPGCLVADVKLPGISGLDVLRALSDRGATLPTVMITGAGDVATAVLAMKAGASDFIEKPIGPSELLASVSRALESNRDKGEQAARQQEAKTRMARLTERQREVLDRVLAGEPSKVIAMDLGVSQRTVEVHRAAIMRRLQVGSLPALARLVVLAESGEVASKG